MTVKILDSIDYSQVANILLKSYVPHWGMVGTPDWSPKYVEYLDKAEISPEGLYVGAFDDNKLVGIGAGFVTNWNIADVGEIKTMCICNFGVLPEHQRKGLAIEMVNKLVEIGSSKGIKCVYRICNEELYDHSVLAKCGFVRKIDTVYQMARVMGSDMVDKTAIFKEYGIFMKNLVKMVAGLPEKDKGIKKGIIRDGLIDDTKVCIEILNDYQHSSGITKIWSESEFKKIIENYHILAGSDFTPFFRIWEIDGNIKAFILGRIELIKFKHGDSPNHIIRELGFVSDLKRAEKIGFMNSIILELKEKSPEAFGATVAHAHHEEKAIDKARFNNDRSIRPLYVKILTDELDDWLQSNWKYKSYYITYQR